jgi:nicotinamidase/pyrazinamidase
MRDIIFWDVDTQVDFMEPFGKLSVPGADLIKSNLAILTTLGNIRCIMSGSVDANTPSDDEFNSWPEHCVYGTPGQMKIPESVIPNSLFVPTVKLTTEQLSEVSTFNGQVLFEKQHTEIGTNSNVKSFLNFVDPERIVVYGVATDICVDQTVSYLARELGYDVLVVIDAIKELDSGKAWRCLEDWRSIGVSLQNTEGLTKSINQIRKKVN